VVAPTQVPQRRSAEPAANMLRVAAALKRAPGAFAAPGRALFSVLVLGEHDGGAVLGATAAAVTAALACRAGAVTVVLAGAGAEAAAPSAAALAGVDRVLHCEDARVAHGLAEGLSALLPSCVLTNL